MTKKKSYVIIKNMNDNDKLMIATVAAGFIQRKEPESEEELLEVVKSSIDVVREINRQVAIENKIGSE